MPRARGASRPRGTQKGAPEPRRRGPGTQPGRFFDQRAPGLRRQGPPDLGGRDSGAQTHGSTQLEKLLDAVRVPRPEGSPGRPRKRPDHLIAERGYSYPSCRGLLRRRGISHTVSERKDQRDRRAGRPGRRPGFDREAYRRRSVVERCVNRLKQWRGVATRYEKRAVNYRAMGS